MDYKEDVRGLWMMMILFSIILLIILAHIFFSNFIDKKPSERCVETIQGIRCYPSDDFPEIDFPYELNLSFGGESDAVQLD